LEPRIEIIKAAAIRACQKLAGQTADGEAASLLTHTQPNRRNAGARIWTSDVTGILPELEVHLGNIASITHTFQRGDIQPPAGPASP
jgi:hypothetical protein